MPAWHERTAAARGTAGAGAVRRLGEPVPRARRAVAHRDVREGARAARTRGAAGFRRAGAAGIAAKGETIRRVALVDHVEWTHDGRSWLLALVRVQTGRGRRRRRPYFLPLTLAWEDRDEERHAARSRRRRSPRSASRPKSASSPTPSATSRSAARWSTAIGAGVYAEVGARHAVIPPDRRVRADRRLGTGAPAASSCHLRRAATRSSRSASDLFIKAYRRLQVGVNPEVEIGRYLTDVVHFRNSVPVAGSLDYVAEDGRHDDAGAAAGLRREPGQRLGLHAELSAPVLRTLAAAARRGGRQ